MRILYILALYAVLFSVVAADTLDEALKQIQDRNYPEAIKHLQSIPDVAKNPQLLYLLGNTCYLAGDYPSALRYLDQLMTQFPDSEWQFKARFKKSDIALKEKKFEEAYAIYKTEVSRLTHNKRKAEMAGIYLKYADRFFKPEDLDTKPDYGKALNLYTEAKELGLATDLEQEVSYKQALCYYHLQNYQQSIEIFQKLYTALSKSKKNLALQEQALFHLADSHYWLGQRDKARLLFKDLLSFFPQSTLIPKALYQISLTYNFPNPGNMDTLENGIRILKQLVQSFPSHELAPISAYHIGLACFNLKQYERAIQEFSQVKQVPGASKETQAEYSATSELMVGYSYYYQERYDESKTVWQNYLRLFPNHQRWTEIQKELISLEYKKADNFYRQKQWEKARNQWRDFLLQYPLDSRAAQVMYLLGETFRLEKNWDAAIREWTKLLQKFPGTEESSRAQYEIGRLYESELYDFEKAMETYRTLNWGSYSGHAQEQLRRMKDKELNVLSERIFLSQETPSLKLTTRNFESVKVRVYEVDLLSYFQKMNTIDGLEKLDLALIEPDETFEFKIEKFEKYRVLERALPLPQKFQKPGVYTVNISTETLEAFSVVVVSDLALIVKSTKSDMLVFAENMLLKKPAEGVDIYVSDGKSSLFQGKTDSKGFYSIADERLKKVSQLRVFGATTSGNASNELNLRELSFSKGLEPRGYLYTDRPAYRPGETVHLRGIIREIKNSVYHFDKEALYQLQVLSAEGKQLFQSEVPLSAFGSLSSQFTLPEGTSLGTYRFKVFQNEGSSFNGSFEVQEYQIERFKLSVLPEKSYYYRGETIQGVIKAEYYYGEPVVGKPISFRLQSQGVETAKTDEKGEVKFSFATTDFNEKQLLTIWASLDGENVTIQQTLWLTTKGFELSLSTLRDVFLTSEPFDVQVSAKDIEGKGVSATLTYEVLQLVTTEGNVAEKKVQDGSVTTSAQGEGKFRLTLPTGSPYRVRVRGEDRFKNGISGQLDVFISGEDDQEKLRILTDSDHFRVGDTGQIQILWRGEESLALITHEGEKIYHAYVEPLKKGSNLIHVSMTNLLSPNFALGVAVMEKNTFSQGQKAFKVSRELQLKVSTEKTIYAPGDEVVVQLESLDPQGKGVVSEISLAVIDEALLSLYPDRLPPITTFFYGQERTIKIATTATNTFQFAGKTSQISEEILRELEKAKESVSDRKERPKSPGLRRNGADKSEVFDGDNYADSLEDSIGTGGGEGGTFGGRFGGKKSMSKSGGGGQLAGKAVMALGLEEMEQMRQRFVSTAYWNASIVTENGKASLRFKLPDNTTAWRLVVYGVNGEILVGKATHSIQVRKDFLVELKAPKTLVAGDTPKPLVVVHNQTDKALSASVSLSSSFREGEGKVSNITVEIPAHSVREETFPLDAVAEGQLKLVASARAGSLSDSVERKVRVQPLATLVQEGIGGIATQSFRESVKLPKTSENYSNIQLHLRYGPSLSSLLLTGELSPRSDGITIASNGIAAYFTLRYLETLGTSAKPYSARWFSALESSALHFLINQNTDGGFTYSGMNSQVANHRLNSTTKPSFYSDPNIAALGLRLLVLAKQRGIAGLDNSISQNALYLKNAFSRATTNTEKATILYGMAGTQEIDFAHANRLYRERNALDSYSLALLSLIFSAMDRKEYAKEVAELLAKRDLFQAPSVTRLEEEEKRRAWCWSADPLELIALSANAFIQAGLPQSQVDGLMKHLFARRGEKYWDSPKANAAAVEAIYQYLSHYKPAHQDKYKVEILVEDQVVHTAEVFGSQPVQELPPISLKKPQASVEFRVSGSVQMSYQARISGWLKGIKEIQQNKIFYVKHYYNPSPLLVKGQEVPRGFGVLSGNYNTWKNEVRHLAEGDFTEVEIEYSPQRYYETYDSYLVLEEPIPGGTTVLEPSIQGNFQNYEIRDGRIYFYLNNISGTLRYRLYGYLQGGYQILPSRIWNLFEPYRVSTGTPEKLTILSRDAKNPDPFKHTPQELYYLGKFHFDESQYPQAERFLSELFKYENLQDSYYKDVVRMLLYTSIERNNSQDIVKYFEILKERDPSLFIDFERILKIGTAYGDIKEFERGLQVFKATTEANFSKEANVSGTLNEQGELESSIEFMRTLLQNYPDIPVVQTALYSLSQFAYESSAQVKQNPELQKKISCETLIQKAITLLDQFLTLYPDNPMADEASFSLANIYLERKDFARSVELGKIFTQRFPKSFYLDDFLYIEGYSNFYLREYEKALQQLKRLSEERFPATGNTTTLSENRFLAQYIMGQIYHSRGEFKQAREYYLKIQDRFEDAKDAIAYFEQKQLSLEEITTFKTGESVSIQLTHRNIPEVDIKVFKVDLMMLYLLKKNLNQITNIHLAGIKPSHARVEAFTDEYREVQTKLTLPLEKEGAYLVVAKGADQNCSGMVLVSDLKLMVQEDAESGTVRVNVMNAKNNTFVDEAHVKVTGSSPNCKFQSGNTDLRGIFVVSNVQGSATAIVKKDNQYAFFRGSEQLQRPSGQKLYKRSEENLNKLIETMNTENRQRQSQQLKALFQDSEEGVEVEQTK